MLKAIPAARAALMEEDHCEKYLSVVVWFISLGRETSAARVAVWESAVYMKEKGERTGYKPGETYYRRRNKDTHGPNSS